MTKFSPELKSRLDQGYFPKTIYSKLGLVLKTLCFPFIIFGGIGFTFMALGEVQSYERGQLLRVLVSNYMSGVYLLLMLVGLFFYAIGAAIKKADN